MALEEIKAKIAQKQRERAKLDAFALFERGSYSDAEIARRVGVSSPTIKKWRTQYLSGDTDIRGPGRPAARMPVPEPATSPADDADPDDLDDDSIEAQIAALDSGEVAGAEAEMRALVASIKRQKAHAIRQGNVALIARHNRDMAAVLARLERIEARRAAEGGGVMILPDQLDAARRLVDDRVRALASRPLLCAHCHRKLSILWGTGSSEEPEPGEGAA